MAGLFAIGEVLVDFIPEQKGKDLKDVVSFERVAGGAPANVAAAVAIAGGTASMITKLGVDAFGDFLVETLNQVGVNTKHIFRTKDANTALAFVSLKEDGERDFSFYRNPSADLLLTEEEMNEDWFNEGDILHFCSVDLVESPMKHAHSKAIRFAREKGAIVSFDPNVRLPLWEDPTDCRNTILQFIPEAHIVKISDEELSFITGITNEQDAIDSLFVGNVKVVLFTKGSKGADLYVNGECYQSSGYPVSVQDTTGAGDAFIGGFLYKLLEKNVTIEKLTSVLQEDHRDILSYANASGALTTTGKGAMSSIPTKEQVYTLMKEHS